MMCPPTSLCTSHTTLMRRSELRTLAPSLPPTRALRKPPSLRLHAVLVCAALLLCLDPASTPARQQPANLWISRSSLPQLPLANTTATLANASVAGTVLDPSGATVSGADVSLMHSDGTQSRAMVSDADGEFSFIKILPGSYLVTVNAKGFALFTSSEFVVAPQGAYEVPDILLGVATASLELTVRPTDLIAADQIKAEEKQRLIGVVPNFYTSYVHDAAPLTWKQKYSLAARGTFDPVSMIGVAFSAGFEQATNAYAGYGQGAEGYSKRAAARFAYGRSSDFLTHAVFPSLFHQDPRYYYQGTGSVKSRFVHAVSSAFITRGDSGRTVPNYSYFLGDLSAGALSNLYYPQANRGAHLVFTNAAVGLAGRLAGNLLREFLPKHSTTNVPADLAR